MTDLEELREALHTRPSEPLPQLDIRQIMVAGGRLRRRRRIRTVAVSATVLSALVGGMTMGSLGHRGEVLPAAPPTSAPGPTAGPTMSSIAGPTMSSTAGPTMSSTAGPTMSSTAGSIPTGTPTPSGSMTPTAGPSLAASATPLISPSRTPVTPTSSALVPPTSR